jgi:hypothetical protein
MPKLSEDEIINAIENGELRALSLDTNVFHRPDYNLQAATLRKLAIFYLHGIEIIFPEVIAGEIRSHIAGQLRTTDADLEKALEKYTKKWRLDFKVRDDTQKACGLGTNPEDTATDYWKAFLKEVQGAEFGPDGLISVSEMMRMYFTTAAPFEQKADKKNEFPDAIALLSLEAWAASKGCLLLAISQDGGWRAYGENSKAIVVLPDIHQAYAIINRSAQAIAMAIVDLLAQKKAPDLDHRIIDVIQRRLDDLDFDVEAESYLSIDAQPENAVVNGVSYFANPSVLEVDADQVTFAILVTASIEVSAEFTLSVREDGENHAIDATSETITRDVEFEVVITVPKVATEDPEVLDIEINRSRLKFQFGYLEPFAREISERTPDDY